MTGAVHVSGRIQGREPHSHDKRWQQQVDGKTLAEVPHGGKDMLKPFSNNEATEDVIRMLEGGDGDQQGSRLPKQILPGQHKVLEWYTGNACQISVAVLIFLNFILSALEAQLQSVDSENADQGEEVFTVFEMCFNVLFAMELVMNLYANFFLPFWKSLWNVFDVMIVIVSWVSMMGNVPGITVLRLFRAFRAFRLFKRIESVRIIIVGVLKSLPGVSNAFLLLLIIMGIWAIMGVSFFRHDFEDMFGSFTKAMLTLFQVMTFDSWVSQVTRPICLYYNSWAAPIYFITYTFISGIIMTNVVVAILLEKFMAASNELEAEEAKVKMGEGVNILPGEHEPAAESQEHFRLLEEHFAFRLKGIDEMCRSPLPETKQAQLLLEQTAKEQMEIERMERRKLDKVPGQSRLKEIYESRSPQIFVATAICINFLVSMIQAQILPEAGSPADDFFTAFEFCLNALFLAELLVNLYANFFCSFWRNTWNIFDFAIVMISWASMLGDMPGISVLRLFRAFRVFRLFKRIKSLRQIIAGVLTALPGVSNAFVILGLVMGIWSIMGKNFFGPDFPNEFGNFFRAMLTMFQIMSYDSWSSGITRPVIFKYSPSPVAPIFFVTYVFISAIIMSNVVLAILLDKFLKAAKEFEEKENPNAHPELGLTEIMNNFKPGMEIMLEHVRDFEDKVTQRLDELEQLMDGPLRNFFQEQKSRVAWEAEENGTSLRSSTMKQLNAIIPTSVSSGSFRSDEDSRVTPVTPH